MKDRRYGSEDLGREGSMQQVSAARFDDQEVDHNLARQL